VRRDPVHDQAQASLVRERRAEVLTDWIQRHKRTEFSTTPSVTPWRRLSAQS
jgi:hypothetical protein